MMPQVDEIAAPAEPVFIGTERPEALISESFALKHENTFAVADAYGDIYGSHDGLFRNDTRVLSLFRLSFGGRTPSLLSSSVSRDNVFFTAHMTNRPLPPLGGRATSESMIHVERTRFLWEERLYERIRLHNYETATATVPLSLDFDADFRDMFEVRGASRPVRGQIAPPILSRGADPGVAMSYRGLDDLVRNSVIAFSVAPVQLGETRADFAVSLASGAEFTLYVELGPDAAVCPGAARFRAGFVAARAAMRRIRREGATVSTSNPMLDQWVQRSQADVALLTSALATGPYPYAGIPWFSTPFGRDGIVTALEMLWLDPKLACGVLRFLALHQASETSSFRDSAPGKIMHETRRGEMCTIGELPFGMYYGGVDTTPMFVMLAGKYAERTGELSLIDELWPALCRAIGWIEGVCDRSPNRLLDYARGAASGLANQGWKDSEDSVFHRDGSFPKGPIALIEVQGYAFSAFETMSSLATRRGATDLARGWSARARAIQEIVEARFWMPKEGFYGIALDGDGKLCETLASNAGHLLLTGLPSPERAARVIERLGGTAFRSGWGIRTLAFGEARYNPMSYHNGSVWPHDTALCASGMRRHAERQAPLDIFNQLLATAGHFGMRLPELFCGFARTDDQPPIGYPVACLPQAWSAGAAMLMLQTVLGISVDGWSGTVNIEAPQLPGGVRSLSLRRLQVGSRRIDLSFELEGDSVVAYLDGPADAAPVVRGARLRPPIHC